MMISAVLEKLVGSFYFSEHSYYVFLSELAALVSRPPPPSFWLITVWKNRLFPVRPLKIPTTSLSCVVSIYTYRH